MAAIIPLENRIGETVREVVFPIEAGKIKEFARASHSACPVYFDNSIAADAGFPNIPAPPTFSVSAAFYSGGDATELPLKLGLDLSRTVDGERAWEFQRMPIAGDVLHARSVIADVTRRVNAAGRRMCIITIVTTFTDESGALVMTETMRTIELGQ